MNTRYKIYAYFDKRTLADGTEIAGGTATCHVEGEKALAALLAAWGSSVTEIVEV